MKKTYRNKEGVTLIELMVVISIITILSVLTVIGAEVIRRERVSQVSRELYADLANMRLSAMTRSPAGTNTRGYGIRVVDQTTYVIFRFNDANDNLQYDNTGEEVDTVTKTVPNNVLLVVNTILGTAVPNNNVLIFDGRGYNRGPAWGFLNMTITISHTDAGIQRKCVTISPNRIREGFWDGTNCTVQ